MMTFLVIFLEESATLCSFDIDLKYISIIREFPKRGIVNGFFSQNGTELKLICRDQILLQANMLSGLIEETKSLISIRKST